MKTLKRPAYVTDKHLRYLDRLREKGVVMAGAAPWLQVTHPELTVAQAKKTVQYWAATLDDKRH